MTRAGGAVKRTATRTSRSSTTRNTGRQADAIALLTDDHREVEELFVRFEKTGAGARKRRGELVERITQALSVHAFIEEEILYPAIRRSVADAGDDVLEALEEHHLVKLTLAELETMDPSHERYGAKVTVLIENVRHHVAEEEGELFPRSETRSTEISSVRSASSSPQPSAPHPTGRTPKHPTPRPATSWLRCSPPRSMSPRT